MFAVPDAAAAAVDGRHVRQSGADALAVAAAIAAAAAVDRVLGGLEAQRRRVYAVPEEDLICTVSQ